MKKFQVGILIILVIIVGFVFWYNVSQKAEPTTTSQPLKIGFLPWIGNGVYYVAQEKNLFQKEGANVEFVDVSDTATGKQLLQTSKIDAIYLTPETVAILEDVGVKVKVFAANDLSAGADGIVAKTSIQRLEDLKGKSVAFEVGSPSHFLISYLLNEHGLTTNDLKVVNNTAPDAGAAFVAGKVDAAVTWEPWLTQASQQEGHLLASSKDAPVVFDMLIIRTDVANAQPQNIKAILRAVFAAQEWISSNKNEAAEIISKPLKITPQEAMEQMQGVHWLSYKENLEKFSSGTFSTRNSIQVAGDLWLKLGLIKNKLNVNKIVDDTLLKNLY